MGAIGSGQHLMGFQTELNSHANMCMIGANALVVHCHDRHIMVVLYDPASIRGRDILKRVTNQGFHGELIGFL